jgi:hypothetical protein
LYDTILRTVLGYTVTDENCNGDIKEEREISYRRMTTIKIMVTTFKKNDFKENLEATFVTEGLNILWTSRRFIEH